MDNLYKYKRVGAMWYNKESDRFSISIEGTFEKNSRIYVFVNTKKKTERAPDYNLCVKNIDKEAIDMSQEDKNELGFL